MSVFVDTGVFYAHQDTGDARHDDAVDLFDDVLDGTYGQPYTSDDVLEETGALARVRTGSLEAADTVARRILGEGPYDRVSDVIHVEPDDVHAALGRFREYDDRDLNFPDAATVALCEARGIDAVASFDADFDGIVDRIGTGA